MAKTVNQSKTDFKQKIRLLLNLWNIGGVNTDVKQSELTKQVKLSSEKAKDQYIDQIYQKIALRSHIIKLFKDINQSVTLEYFKGRYDSLNPPQPSLSESELKFIFY